MKKITDINENLHVKEIIKKRRTIISVIDGDKEILLSDIKTDDYFWNKWISDDNYIVAYSRGCMVNQIPLNIEAAYSIKNKRLLNLSNKKIKVLLEYMLIAKKGFDLANVLSEINNGDLGLLSDDEKEDLNRYLTLGNRNITHSDVINYILQFYPQLEKYTGLKDKLSVSEYRSIKEDLDESTFWFHAIPQELTFLKLPCSEEIAANGTNYMQIYMSENDQQQRVLNLKKEQKKPY